jgi:pimeloyl-ACP methyl ester carboxylesterase
VEIKHIQVHKKQLQYRVVGEGLPVMLVHGFGEDGTIWENQYQGLPGFRLLVPDLPGSGGSDMAGDMSMEGLADTLALILDAEVPTSQKVVLIGHSMGGYVTLAFAEKYPERLRAFGLFHSTAFADSEEKKQNRRKGIDLIRREGVEAFLQPTIQNLYASITKEQHPEIIDQQLQTMHNFSGEALVSYYEAMIARPDRTEVLKKSSIPVLLVLGRWDAAVPIAEGLKLCTMPDLLYIHILDYSGHMGMREEPAAANELLKNFLLHLEKTT